MADELLEKTQAELFKAELDALLAKYPTVKLNVVAMPPAYTISIDEMRPPKADEVQPK